MKEGLSFFGGSDILDDSLAIYKQDNHLCFENIFGDITRNPLRVFADLLNIPPSFEVNYEVSLYESPTVGFDKLIWAKQSCRVAWVNLNSSYVPFWSPWTVNLDLYFVEDDISYNNFPSNCFQWKRNGNSQNSQAYGQEYILSYDEDENMVGNINKLNQIDLGSTGDGFFNQNMWEFLRTVFYSDEFKKFIALSSLDEKKEYNLKVEINISDWQFGTSNFRKSDDFKLSDIPNRDDDNTDPTASFTVDPTSGTTSTIFNFDASGSTDNEDLSSALQVRWDWEDDGIWDTGYSTIKTITNQYTTEGTKTIKLEVKDTGGLTDITTKQITVGIEGTAPTASFTVDPTSGTTSTVFNFDASGCTDNEDPTSALEVRWDWEDDGIWDTEYSTTKVITNQYTTEGTKTVKMEVKDTGGLTDDITKEVLIDDGNETGTVTDIDGNVYQTIKIGNQWWMAENLKVTHFRNGDAIPNVTNNDSWGGLSTGAYCAYNNDNGNVETYGLLYNWSAVDDYRNIAPAGWRVQSDVDWKQLEMYLGMSQSEAEDTGWRGTDEGDKLKATSGWNSNGNGTNESGFTALPSGYRKSNGTFDDVGNQTAFWSTSEYDYWAVWNRGLHSEYSSVFRYYTSFKRLGFSVRCVRN